MFERDFVQIKNFQNKISKNFPNVINKKSAFSLVKFSVVILFIAAVINSVVGGKGYVKAARIEASEYLAQFYNIVMINDLAFWVESIGEHSFLKPERFDGKELTRWRSRISFIESSPSSNNPFVFNERPKYSYDGVKGVPSVQFDGSDQSFVFECDFLNNSDYTIAVTEQRDNGNSNQYFLQGDNNNLFLGYNYDDSIIHSQFGVEDRPKSPKANTNSYSATVTPYLTQQPKRVIFVSSAAGKKMYINGLEAASSTDTSKIAGISTCYIGKGYKGKISEVAIYTRALPLLDLPDEEITDSSPFGTMADLSSSSHVSFRTPMPSGEKIIYGHCYGGIVSDIGGCVDADCILTNTPGSSTKSVDSGSVGQISCDQIGYVPSKPFYNCINGRLKGNNPSCTQITCTITGVAGFNNKTTLPYAASATPIPNSPTIACVSGYSGSPSYICTTIGPATIIGSCVKN